MYYREEVDIMNSDLIIVALVAALVELGIRLEARDYRAAVTIIGSGLIGGIIGFLKIHGVSIENGIVIGLSASGLISGGQHVAKKVGRVV